jgi:hypothetical protein
MEAFFRRLRPVTYAYKANPTDPKVGFIAEEVPELVADPERKSLSPMDMVALLTKVVQVKDREMEAMRAKIAEQDEKIAKLQALQKKVSALESLLSNLALSGDARADRKLSRLP